MCAETEFWWTKALAAEADCEGVQTRLEAQIDRLRLRNLALEKENAELRKRAFGAFAGAHELVELSDDPEVGTYGC